MISNQQKQRINKVTQNLVNPKNNIINEEIQAINSKINDLFSFAEQINQTLENKKVIHLKEKQYQVSNLYQPQQQILMTLQLKIKILIQQISKSLKKMMENLHQKIKSKNPEKYLSSFIVNLQNKYKIQIEQIKKFYQKQIIEIQQSSKQLSLRLQAKLQLIQKNFQLLNEQNKQKQSKYLQTINNLENKLKSERKIKQVQKQYYVQSNTHDNIQTLLIQSKKQLQIIQRMSSKQNKNIILSNPLKTKLHQNYFLNQQKIQQTQRKKQFKKVKINSSQNIDNTNTQRQNSNFPTINDFSVTSWQQSSVKNLTRVWEKFDDQNSQEDQATEYFLQEI